MFNQNSNKHIGIFSCTVVALIATVLTSVSVTQKTPDDQVATEKTRPLVGRVLADVSTLTFGAGLGPKYTSFIFGAEEGGSAHVVPVKVSYAFFKSDGPPPESFFDYSKRYELQAVREPKCDESVNSLSYVKNADESGKPLPPTYVLRFLEGAPKVVLKPDAVLPCYVLRPSNYKLSRPAVATVTMQTTYHYDGPLPCAYKFTGKERDSESGAGGRPFHTTQVKT